PFCFLCESGPRAGPALVWCGLISPFVCCVALAAPQSPSCSSSRSLMRTKRSIPMTQQTSANTSLAFLLLQVLCLPLSMTTLPRLRPPTQRPRPPRLPRRPRHQRRPPSIPDSLHVTSSPIPHTHHALPRIILRVTLALDETSKLPPPISDPRNRPARTIVCPNTAVSAHPLHLHPSNDICTPDSRHPIHPASKSARTSTPSKRANAPPKPSCTSTPPPQTRPMTLKSSHPPSSFTSPPLSSSTRLATPPRPLWAHSERYIRAIHRTDEVHTQHATRTL
ncbi:hypothetical protein R3P38DRAFT_3559905, partial [Favolaschia claudopus]